MIAKFLIVELHGEEWPIVWPSFQSQHAEVAARLRPLGARLVSAGFTMPADNWAVHGDSLSLGLASRGEPDSALLRHHFGETAPRLPGVPDGFAAAAGAMLRPLSA